MSSGMRLEIPCSSCGSPNEVDPERLADAHAEVRCRDCGDLLIVLSGDGAPPEAAAPSSSLPSEPVPDAADLLMDVPSADRIDSLPPRSRRESATPVLLAGEEHSGGRAGAATAAAHSRGPADPRSADAPGAVACPACGHRFSPSSRERRRSVLIVEDTSFFMDLATEALGERYRTIGVKTAADALDVLGRETVDLIVLDLALPDGAGTQVLKAARDPRRPVLIYTSASEEVMFGEAWHELQALGANDVIFKGVNAGDALVEKVSKLLAAPA